MKKQYITVVSLGILLAASLILGGCISRKASVTAQHNSLQNKSSFYFLFLSDVHLATDISKSVYGQDAGTDLWNTCKSKIDSILKSASPPAFILYTGDMPEHGGISNPPLRDQNIDTLFNDLSKMSAIRNIPLFYLPGNNDALGGDYCFFSDASGQTPFSLIPGNSPYPYKSFHVSKTPSVQGAYMISDANIKYGYYAAKIMNGLRVISLNSVLWSSQVCHSCNVPENCDSQQIAGAKQMAWLEQQLASASNSGDKVYLAMHVPPGADAFASRKNPANPVMMWKGPQDQSGWQDMFLSIVAQYRQTVAGLFFGHTHMDEFRLLYDNSTNDALMQVAISCPGISPIFGNNPGFKLVMVDSDTKLPMDFTTFYTTVNPISWKSPYSFSQLSRMKPGSSIYDAIKQMTPEERIKVLESIYTVKHGSVTNSYDTLGMNVKYAK